MPRHLTYKDSVHSRRSLAVIDQNWVKQLREWWKKWVRKAQRFDVDRDPPYGDDPKDFVQHLEEQEQKCIDTISNGLSMLKRAQHEVVVNKGFWAEKGREYEMLVNKWSVKIINEFDAAIETLNTSKDHIQHTSWLLNPTNPRWRSKFWEDPSKDRVIQIYRTKVLDAFPPLVHEAAKKADAIFSGRLLRFISRLLSEYGDLVDPIQRKTEDVISIGDAKIIFLDTDPSGKGRHPESRREYLKYLHEAYALLRRRKLGRLWYGEIYIKSHDDAPSNPLGVRFGVGATYHTSKDIITFYMDPRRDIPRLLIHELGHRYYYKFMRQKDRMTFDSFFMYKKGDFVELDNGKRGVELKFAYNPNLFDDILKIDDAAKFAGREGPFYVYHVPWSRLIDIKKLAKKYNLTSPTTDYGGTIPSEDFAEVFADYVIGRNVFHRSQIERLKKFLTASVNRPTAEKITKKVLSFLDTTADNVTLVDMSPRSPQQ